MSLTASKSMTLEEFLEWEERQPLKHEFDGFGPVAMSGGTIGHAAIQANLARSLGNRLLGGPCRFFGSDLKFLMKERVRYPDGVIVCGPTDSDAKWLETPRIVFEVLSPGTARTDRVVKASEYQATPSVMRYVMLEADGIGAVVFARKGEIWMHELLDEGATLRLPEVGVELPLAELYEGVNFAKKKPSRRSS